jgi:hypothetical protein
MPSLKHKSEEAGLAARPRFGRLATAIAYSGIGRSSLYNFAAQTPGLFRKNGVAIIVDFDVLDKVLDELPLAKIKPKSATGE